MAIQTASPSGASAAPCPVNPGNATSWIGGSGSFNQDSNWSNGGPSSSCDASITAAGNYTVTMTAGANMKSLTLGGTGSTPQLVMSDQNPNTILSATTAGITIAPGSSIQLTCPAQPTGCLGGPSGGPQVNAGSSNIVNNGTIRVDASSGTGARLTGNIENNGLMDFDQSATHAGGTLDNKSDLVIADTKVLSSTTSHCGDSTGTVFFNDAGGTLTADGSGTLDVVNYQQGDGDTFGTNPVQKPCGSLKYTGDGDSKVRAYGGFALSGDIAANQDLTVSSESVNTIVTLQGDVTNSGDFKLTCPESGCLGGSSGGSTVNVAGHQFTNEGTFAVDADSGTGAGIDAGSGGTITNSGTFDLDQDAYLKGQVVNQGAIDIADGKTVTSSSSSCGDAYSSIFNDVGGSINAAGTGVLSVRYYDQGDGVTTGAAPVTIPCGRLRYLGDGASKVRATGGFNLHGDIAFGQELTVSAESSNTNVVLQSDVGNEGRITLTCPGTGCSGGSGGGVGFNGNGRQFNNDGIFTIDSNSGTGSGIGTGSGGQVTNTGVMNFDQSSYLAGRVVNQGEINIFDGDTVTMAGSSCGDTGSSLLNDTGGSINGTGTGRLSVYNYEQGNGTTSGEPVFIPCGSLKYLGSGASSVQVGGASMTGNIASGQTLRLGSVNSPPFSNAGTIVLDQSAGNANLNTSKVTNTGRIETSGPSANTSNVSGEIDQTGATAAIDVVAGTKLSVGSTVLLKAGTLGGGGTLQGTVDNSGAKVIPGASPGTLTLTGNYTQGAGGRLEIDIAGVGAGQFDHLAVGGNAFLDGTLALVPSAGYVASSAIGDSVDFLTYGGTATGSFAATTSNPALGCPKVFAVGTDATGKLFKASVVDGGAPAACPVTPVTPVTPTPPVDPVPNTNLKSHPKSKIKTSKKVKVKFAFGSDLATATFQCKIDKKAYSNCKSPKTYTVKPGKHKFSVRAIGPGGTDPTPATFSFKVIKKKKGK